MNKTNKAILTDLAITDLKLKYPNVPDHCVPAPKYSDKTANGLTKCIIDLINFSGGHAERISNQGQYRDNTKIDIDVIGRARTIGSKGWTKGQGQNGTADISAMYRGKSFRIEVKIGRDKMSEAQIKYKKQVENAGAYYIIAKNYDDFILDFKSILLKK